MVPVGIPKGRRLYTLIRLQGKGSPKAAAAGERKKKLDGVKAPAVSSKSISTAPVSGTGEKIRIGINGKTSLDWSTHFVRF